MNRGRLILAWAVPLSLVGILVGATIRDRTIDPVVAGGLIAILSSIVALFATASKGDDE